MIGALEMIAAIEKRKLDKKEYRERRKEERRAYGREWYKMNKDRLCELINCWCGGRFQYQGKAEHLKSKMHANFILKQQAEAEVSMEETFYLRLEQEQEEIEHMLQEVEDIKEQEIRDNNAEVETWKAEDLQREKEKAEEDARLDAEFEIWSEAQQACRLGYKNREEKAPEIKPYKTTRRTYFGRFRSDYDEPAQPVIQTKMKHVVHIQVKKGF